MQNSNYYKIIQVFIPFFLIILFLFIYSVNFFKENWISFIKIQEHESLIKQKQAFEISFSKFIEDSIILSEITSMYINEKSNIISSDQYLGNLFLKFAKNRKSYDQIRYIDDSGQEIVRINYNEKQCFLVDKEKLQNKRFRDFFIDSIKCNHRIYISKFDLNIENNKIEIPYKPVIRIICKVINNKNEIKGIIVLNYICSIFFERLKKGFAKEFNSQFYLINEDGYFLIGPGNDSEFGFILKDRSSEIMSKYYPDEWKYIKSKEEGQIKGNNGLVSFYSMYSHIHDNDSNNNYSVKALEKWYLISIVNQKDLTPPWYIYTKYIYLFINFFVFLIIYLIERINYSKKMNEKKIHDLSRFPDENPNPILRISENGKILYSNKASSFLLNDWQLTIGNDVTEKLKKIIDKCFKTGKSHQQEFEYCKGWISIVFTPIIDRHYVNIYGIDVSVLKQIEKELRDHQEHLDELVMKRTDSLEQSTLQLKNKNKILKNAEKELKKSNFELKQSLDEVKKLYRAVEQSPASVVITNKKGIIEYVNPKFSEVTGYSFEEAIGNNPSILKSGDLPKSFYKNLWATILSGKIWKGDFINITKNGNEYWEHASISPILDDNGKITHFVAVKEDVSLRKKMEEDLIKAKLNAEAANQAKSDFLAIMSHEIRTPLNAIIGMSYLLVETGLNKKQQEYISRIQFAGKTLLKIINDILDFSKIEAGKLELDFVTFQIDELINNVYSIISFNAHDKGINILLNYDNKIPLNLIGDSFRLSQVLINLASNAVKFSDKGDVEITVQSKEINKENVKVKFSVKDTGIGLSDDQIKKLFNPFTQANTSTTRQYGGTGLGLAICKRLVEAMGGNLNVKSKLGHGSIFYFTIDFTLDRLIKNEKDIQPFDLKQLSNISISNLQSKEVKKTHTSIEKTHTSIKKTDTLINKIDNLKDSELIEWLNKLEPFIKNHQPKDCKKIINMIEDKKVSNDIEDSFNKLINYIKKYQFDNAQIILNDIKQAIHNKKI